MSKRTWLFVGALLGFVFIGMCGYRIAESQKRAASAQAAAAVGVTPSVAVASVVRKDVQQTVELTGVIRAKNEVAIFPKMGGRVTKVNAEVGQLVKAGDTLAFLENAELFLHAKQAEAQLAAARAGLESATVQSDLAATGFGRADALHKRGSLSQAELDGANAQRRMAAVGVQSAGAQVALAEAALGLANQALADARVTTPIAGIVSKRLVDTGAQTSPAMTLFTVQDQSALKMEGTVAATEVPLLKSGLAVSVAVDELPGKAFEGVVSQVAPTLEQETRRARIEVSLKPAAGLLPYMFGHASVSFGERAALLTVPAQAVLTSTDGPRVFTVNNGKVRLVKPQLASRSGDDYVVESGLVEGDSVVVSGDAGLQDGIAVAVVGDS